MKNLNQRPTQISLQKCKRKVIVNVNSELYNEDINYQKSINEILKSVL